MKEAEAYLQGHPGLRFSGLVSNAGIGYHMPIEDMGMKEIRRLFDVNTFGAVAVTQRFIPLLRQHQVLPPLHDLSPELLLLVTGVAEMGLGLACWWAVLAGPHRVHQLAGRPHRPAQGRSVER